jgi:hypothetical protein
VAFAISWRSALRLQRPSSLYRESTTVAPPPFSWTGFYIGGFAGGAWAGSVTATELAPGPGVSSFFNGIGNQSSFDLGSRFMGGLDFGYNYQAGVVVAGLEAEGGFLRLKGSAPFIGNRRPAQHEDRRLVRCSYRTTCRSCGPCFDLCKRQRSHCDVTDSVVSECLVRPRRSARLPAVIGLGSPGSQALAWNMQLTIGGV